jgi:adenine-specific DNA-methyltransferase
LDGWLIKSENYQALNTILNKFAGKIKVIYIDPPYNTGSDEFLYEDKHRHSSWLAMMENRLSLARGLLSDDGVIFISIGDTLRSQVRINSASRLQILCNQIFGEDNLIATLVRKSGIAPRQDIRHIANSHDYVLCYAKNIDRAKINRRSANASRLRYRDEHFNERGYFSLNQLDRGSIQYSESLDYPIIIEKGTIIEIFDGITFKKLPAPERIEIWPGGDPNDKRWIFRWSEEKVMWGIENDFIVFKKDRRGKWKVYYKEYELVDNEGRPRERTNPYDTLILEFPNELGTYEIKNLFNERVFEYPKPSDLIKHLLKIGSCNDSLILDFFAGSGTTAHAVMKLNKEDGGNRKFILVEMADYFETVILPRIKKVAYSFNWEDGKPQDTDGLGVFFKYYELEQFEDTLAKVVYEDLEPLAIKGKIMYEQDIFMGDKKMSDVLELDYEKGNVRVDLSKLYDNIDIAETLSNVLGKWIKRITKDSVEFEDGTSVSLAQLDYKLIKPLIWW